MTAPNSKLGMIDHIVVLMLENRSFDNMLGWLYDPGNAPPIKTVANRWGLAALTERDKAAHDLSEALTLDRPRSDRPEFTPLPVPRVHHSADEPLNDFQRSLLGTIAAVVASTRIDANASLGEKIAAVARALEEEVQIRELKTIGQAWQYMKAKLDLTFQYEEY
jgi:hypothetical protein